MALFAKRIGLIDTENAFKIGPYIKSIEDQGKKVIKCNLGEPDFPVPGFIKEEVKRQLDLDNTHYCDPQGILPLRKAIAKQLSESRGIQATPERVVVFPGAKPPIGLSQQTYCDPGDEIVYPSPGFPIYESFINYIGAQPVPVHLKEERGFSLTGEDMASVLSKKTKLIFLNFPSNPTGGMASPEQLQDIADVIRRRGSEEIRIFSDEVYILPYTRELVELAHSYGHQMSHHCCGAIHRYIPRFIEIGVDGLHPLQALARNMDAETLSRDFKGQIAFIGGIDTQQLLIHATPEEVKAEVRRVKGWLGPCLIVSPSHEALLSNVPPENVVAMAEAAREPG